MPKLIWLFGLPILSSLLVALIPCSSKKRIKEFASILSFFPLLLIFFYGYNSWIGEEARVMWMSSLSIEFYLMADPLALFFVALTATMVPLTLISVRSDSIEQPRVFYALVLGLESLLILFFTARDLVLFTICWEAMLIPLYFIISIWGGEGNRAAALKFLIYMIAGSVLMVAAILALYISTGSQGTMTFSLDILQKTAQEAPFSSWICAILLLAFAVKTPLFPFHAWLPEAYCEAPTAGSILLSSLLSKAGVFGFLRIGVGLFPIYMEEWSGILLPLAIAGVLYGGLAAWMQTDFKRLIAYSSFSHVNFILAGIFVWNEVSQQGAILQALNHSITIAGLFITAGWLEERLGSTQIAPFSGMAKYLPHLCWLTLVFVLSSVALPGTNNFIGELLILFGLFTLSPWMAAILGLTVILSVIYMLRWIQDVYFSRPSLFQHQWMDVKRREFFIALPLIALIFWIGIYPAPALRQISNAVSRSTAAEQMEVE